MRGNSAQPDGSRDGEPWVPGGALRAGPVRHVTCAIGKVEKCRGFSLTSLSWVCYKNQMGNRI